MGRCACQDIISGIPNDPPYLLFNSLVQPRDGGRSLLGEIGCSLALVIFALRSPRARENQARHGLS